MDELQKYILKELGKRGMFEYKCIKKGLSDIVIDSGLEASIKNDGEFRGCYFCDGLSVTCKRYEPLIYLMNIKKREDKK